MRPYAELNSHHIGKSHVQNGSECEDYSISYADEIMSAIAVSDGHGDKNCFRSKMGARIACEISINLLKVFKEKADKIANVCSDEFDCLIRSLETSIVERWTQSVLLDAQNNPISEQELSPLSPDVKEMYTAGKRIEKAYGCTLIAALITGRYWLALQIGDGKCVAAYEDGVFVEPVPRDDENNYGNHSASLCNTEARQAFRHYASPLLPLAVFVASDGVEESFDNQGLMNCFYSVAYWLKDEGREAALSKLNELLPQISEGGSGDDVSLAALVHCEAPLSSPRQTLDQVYERVNGCKNLLDRLSNLFEEASGTLEAEIKSQNRLKEEISQAEKQLTLLKAELEKQDQKCEEKQIALDGIEEKRKKAVERMEKAQKYQESAERFWRGKQEELGLPSGREAAEQSIRSADMDASAPDIPQAALEEKSEALSEELSPQVVIAAQPSGEERVASEVIEESLLKKEVPQNDVGPEIEPLVLPEFESVQAPPEGQAQSGEPDYSCFAFKEFTKVYNKDAGVSDDKCDSGGGSNFGKRFRLLRKKEK